MKGINLADLAEKLGGTLEGDPDAVVTGVGPLESAGPDDVTFLSDSRYLSSLGKTSARCVIVSKDTIAGDINIIRVDNPYLGFAVAMELLYSPPYEAAGISERSYIHDHALVGKEPSIHPFAVVCEGARIGDRVTLMAGAYAGPFVTIGDDTTIHPNVVLEKGVQVGSRVIIHAGTVVGSDGFGYAQEDMVHRKILHAGTVRIEDDVEVGAGCTIDRAVFGETVIGSGSKLDNLVHIAHNAITGQNCLMTGQTGLAGSAEIGDNVIMAGQSGVGGHIKVGSGTIIMARAGVTKDAPPGARLAGFPATDDRIWRRSSAVFNRLDELRKRILQLEKELSKIAKGSSEEEE
ncbi:MAG: UDP-3-O-(3-hydroxymyristoyl)glucosamine N-acyltransferase [Pseudomonadota bacterium]